jgi:transcriptional regulator of aromatic amino acid metabolism
MYFSLSLTKFIINDPNQTSHVNAITNPCPFAIIDIQSELQVKQLLQLVDGVLRAVNGVSNGARVFVNLVIVSSDEGLIAEEVDGRVFDTRDVLLRLNVLQAVGLVPAGGEDIERDLTADRIAVLEYWISSMSKSQLAGYKLT